MSQLHRQRMIKISLFSVGILLAAAMILFALKENINLFFTPTDVAEAKAPLNKVIRVGGMVEENSVIKENLNVTFNITDFNETISIHYQGILPDLFREGQGIVALGKVSETGQFMASQVLAKHDENYMPPEAWEAVNRAQLNKTTENKV